MSDMHDPNNAPPPAADLQFERAEFVSAQPDLRCTSCQSHISDSYYHVSGAVTCPACAEHRRFFQATPEGGGTFLRAALFGFGAAVLGSVIYALVSLTGFQFSIVAILVGILVGKAIRHVTQGRSSRRYQVLAVVLTYGAITTSYVPGIIAEAIQKEKAAKSSQSPAPTPAPAAAHKPFSLARFAGGLAVLIGITFALPFLVLLSSPASGLINLVIIGIGLMQAWRLTKPDQAPIAGPFSVAQPSAG